VPVIIDTDIYSNSDDVGALANAFALDLKGTVNVLAIGVNTRTSRPAVATSSWKCAAAIAQFYGFGDVPIGSDMPDNGATVNSPDLVGPCAALASPSTPAPQPVVGVYRRALASAPNGSVDIVGIGYEENLAALLASPPDAISPLDGRDLVAQKVNALYLTAGGYPSRTTENNLAGNPVAAQYVAANWPTKVIYSGYEVGYGVFTGHTLSTVQPATSPVRAAYEAEVGISKNNRSWTSPLCTTPSSRTTRCSPRSVPARMRSPALVATPSPPARAPRTTYRSRTRRRLPRSSRSCSTSCPAARHKR